MRTKSLCIALAALALLHQDTWLWHDGRLVFGFLPAGLAYHAVFSLATAGLWALAVRYAWPAELEHSAPVAADRGDRSR